MVHNTTNGGRSYSRTQLFVKYYHLLWLLLFHQKYKTQLNSNFMCSVLSRGFQRQAVHLSFRSFGGINGSKNNCSISGDSKKYSPTKKSYLYHNWLCGGIYHQNYHFFTSPLVLIYFFACADCSFCRIKMFITEHQRAEPIFVRPAAA